MCHFAINDRLVRQAQRLGKHRTKQDTINAALEHYVRGYRQQRILKDFGTVDFDPEYDYKVWRKRY